MRVLYLHQYFVPPDGHGSTRSYELARRLVQRGHEVRLVTSSALMPGRSKKGRASRLRLEGIELVVLPVNYDNRMTYPERMAAFARFAARASYEAVQEPFDVVFATSTPLTIAIPGLLARVARRAPMVFEVRDLWPDAPIEMGALRNPLSIRAARGLEWVAYHGAEHVVALSEGMADGVARRGIPRERITVIPNGCDVDKFEVPRDDVAALRERLFPELAADQPLVLYAGAFGALNDVGWLVDVAAKMRDIDPRVRFAVVGDGAQASVVTDRARRAGVLDDNLWLRPPVPKRDVPALLGCATVATSLFLPLPVMRNNSANKFFDALAAGKPVAINNEGWQADLLRDTGAGVALPYGDVGAAADALGDLLADRSRLQRASEAARALARERFDRDRLADRLERVLLSAAA